MNSSPLGSGQDWDGLPLGTNVRLRGAEPASIIEARPGQYRCQTADGSRRWVMANQVEVDGSDPLPTHAPHAPHAPQAAFAPPAAQPYPPPQGFSQQEPSGWSWAAFLWGWVWAIGNSTWIGLLGVIPVFGLVMNVVLGVKGKRWARR